jgi:hypothetical protein
VRAFEPTTALSGNPFARPCECSDHRARFSDKVGPTLAKSRRSGRTPLYSILNIRPVLPNPLCTSSMMRSRPFLSHISRSPCKNAGGAGTYPPSPSTGSTMTAAVSAGALCWRSSSSSWYNDARTSSALSAPGAELKWCQYGNGAVTTPGCRVPPASDGVCEREGGMDAPLEERTRRRR